MRQPLTRSIAPMPSSLAPSFARSTAAPPAARRVAGMDRAEIARDLAALETEWRALERAGIASPFQRFDFVTAYVRHVLPAQGASFAAAIRRDGEGRAEMIVPLEIHRFGPFTLARTLGGAHASIQAPLFAPTAALGAEEALCFARAVGRALQADVLSLGYQPETVRGHRNPLLALPLRAGANDCFRLALERDGAALMGRKFSKDARRKLARKAKKLAEFGPVHLVEATTNDEARAILEFFFHHRALRCARQGLGDAFGAPHIRAFLSDAAQFAPGGGAPALTLVALKAGPRVMGMFGLARGGGQNSAMFTAFDMAPDVERLSPGDQLLAHLIPALCERGDSMFDLGAGAMSYKARYCDDVVPLFEGLLPITPQGRLLAAVLGFAAKAKRVLKRDARAMRVLTAMRRWRAGRR